MQDLLSDALKRTRLHVAQTAQHGQLSVCLSVCLSIYEQPLAAGLYVMDC